MGDLSGHFKDKIKSQDVSRISRTSGHPEFNWTCNLIDRCQSYGCKMMIVSTKAGIFLPLVVGLHFKIAKMNESSQMLS